MGIACVVTERNEIATKDLDLLGLAFTEVFTANNRVPEIYIHAIYSS